jgi:hypothetical protein
MSAVFKCLVVVCVHAELHLFDPVANLSVFLDGNVLASIVQMDHWECQYLSMLMLTMIDQLSVTTPEKEWISQQIEAIINPVFIEVLNIYRSSS